MHLSKCSMSLKTDTDIDDKLRTKVQPETSLKQFCGLLNVYNCEGKDRKFLTEYIKKLHIQLHKIVT